MTIFSWRALPGWLVASVLAVALVNGFMIYKAVKTFPGSAGVDGFDLSNHYGKVLDAEKAQAALGWRVEIGVDKRQPILTVLDRNGGPLTNASVDVEAERPVGPKDHTTLALRDLGAGRLLSDTTLFSGQWDLLVTIRNGNDVYSATRRVMVR